MIACSARKFKFLDIPGFILHNKMLVYAGSCVRNRTRCLDASVSRTASDMRDGDVVVSLAYRATCATVT